MNKAAKYYWVIYVVVGASILLPVAKFYLPKIVKFYQPPKQCTVVFDRNGRHEFCLDDKFRPPIECILDSSKSKTIECRSLASLYETNKKEISFTLFGHLITIKRVIGTRQNVQKSITN